MRFLEPFVSVSVPKHARPSVFVKITKSCKAWNFSKNKTICVLLYQNMNIHEFLWKLMNIGAYL